MTSEVEVKVRSEVKFEVRSSKRISRCTSIQNFRFLALEMTELWQLEIKSVTYRTYGTLVTFKSNSKSDKVDLANQTKSIWPIKYYKHYYLFHYKNGYKPKLE